MKKRILSLLLMVSLALQLGFMPTYAAGNDPYAGFKAAAVDDYLCDRPAFSKDKWLGALWPGDWGCYKALDFGDVSPTSVEVSIGVPEGYSKAAELRIDAPDGPRIAYIPITPSGAWAEPLAHRVELEREVTGVHDLYITNANSTSNFFEIKFFKPRGVGAEIPRYDGADLYSDISEDSNRYEINLLGQLDIFRAEKGGQFVPELPVTRGEFVYSIFKLFGENEAEGGVETKFSDVNPQKYYAQAIAYLNGLGVVNGVMADTFRPDDFITQLDAIVIISRVLGYEDLAIAYGGYPYGYTRIASEEKFYIKELGMSDYLRRTHVAEMIYNGISAEALFATGINGDLVNYQKEEGLLYKTRNLTRATGKVVTNYISDLYYPQSDVRRTEVVIDDVVYNIGKTKAASLLGFECEFVYAEEKDGTKTLYAIVPRDGVEMYEISSNTDDIDKIDDDAVVYYSRAGKEITFEIQKDTAVLYNGVAADASLKALVGDVEDFCGTVTFVENRDGKNTVMVDSFVNYVIGSVNIDGKFVVDEKSGKKLNLDESQSVVFIHKNGEITGIEELSEGDLISVYESKNKNGSKYIRIFAATDGISGKIEKTSDSGKLFTINGKDYRVSPSYDKPLSVGQSGVFTLDVMGYIADYEQADRDGKSVGLYINSALEEKPLDSEAMVRIVTTGGKAASFTFADNARIDGIQPGEQTKIINGTGTWAGLKALATEKPVRYSLNSKGEIIWMDTVLLGSNDENNDALIQLSGDRSTHNYQGNVMAVTLKDSSNVSYAIGKFFVPKSAWLFSYYENSETSEENWKVETISDNIARSHNAEGELYSTFGDDYSGDIFVFRNFRAGTSYTKPFVYTGYTEALNEDGALGYTVHGVDGLTEVNYELSEYLFNNGILDDALPGDTLRVKLRGGEICELQFLAFRDGAAKRGVSTALLSAEKGVASGTNRDIRYVYGKVVKKGDDYFIVDVGSMVINGVEQRVTELIERSSATVVTVSMSGRGGECVVDYGMNPQTIAVDDVICAYLYYGGTNMIIVYEDVEL
ncbi:MAG: S-layer homology domain-containing protein [Clostridia bacterium]|nr:S-layer homology domain-containing protein [Clostridia bacterium]